MTSRERVQAVLEHRLPDYLPNCWGGCETAGLHVLPYHELVAALGLPEKAAHWVTRIVNEAFTPDVYPGDEDNGSMAAWYVWSVLGMYPLCPGRDELVPGACQVQRAVIHLPDGSTRIAQREDNA